jgi:hypothetical protein
MEEPGALPRVAGREGNVAMNEKFDPAPTDKYADTPHQKSTADKKTDDELDKGLKESFPASDPPSPTQPSKAGSEEK